MIDSSVTFIRPGTTVTHNNGSRGYIVKSVMGMPGTWLVQWYAGANGTMRSFHVAADFSKIG